MLSPEIAEEIVRETMKRLRRNINIMDSSGTIIASGDPVRVQHFHEGALEVLRTRKPLLITEADLDRFQGAQPGINIPIEFRGKILGVIGITGDKSEVEEFSGLVKMTTEMMVKQAFLTSQIEWKQRTISIMIEELMKASPNWEFIEQRLDLLRIRLHAPYSVAIIHLHESPIQNQKLLEIATESIGSEACLVGFISLNKLFILTMGLSTDEIHQAFLSLEEGLVRLKVSFRMGIGTPVDESRFISLSHHEATLALQVEDRDVVFYSDTEPKVFVYQLDHHLRERYVGKMFPELSPKLVDTLRVFFACNLNIAAASRQLYVHRNTLIYRLNKVKEITGRDPLVFQESVALQFAVWAHDSLSDSTATS